MIPIEPETKDHDVERALDRYFRQSMREASSRHGVREAPIERRARSLGRRHLVGAAIGAVALVIAASWALPGMFRVPTGSHPSARTSAQAAFPAVLAGDPVVDVARYVTSAPTDSRETLIGGWLQGGPGLMSGCIQDPSARGRLVPGCGYFELADWDGGIKTRLAVLDRASIPKLERLVGHPVVLSVHAHDPLAASCPNEQLAACGQVPVVDRIAWPGT